MLSEHVINLPRKVVVGIGVIGRVPTYFRELGLQSPVLIVTGPRIYNVVGKRFEEMLVDEGYETSVIRIERSHIDTAREILEAAQELKASTVVGLGGGKSIDVAKYVAAKLGVKFVSVPTAASHDGIASPFASIKGTGKVTSIRAVEPVLIVADVEVIAKAPRRLLAAGTGDVIAKFTAVLDWRLAHRLRGEYYGEYAASLAILSAKHAMRYADIIGRGDVEGARILVEALISSSVAMCIAGSTRPASGSEHLFSHALDIVAEKPALHGEQVGIGTIMMAYLHGKNWRLIRKTLKQVGAPTTAKELGVGEHHIVEALTIAHKIRPERYTILGDKGLSWRAAENLARITGVIS